MTDELTQRIEHHLSGWESRQKEVEEMKREWHEFKSRALTILIGTLFALVGYGIWVGNIQSQTKYNERQLQTQEEKHILIEQRLGNVEVVNSEVKARLQSIDATLQEIKVAIKNID